VTERDLIPCPGAEHKLIDRADAGGVPSRLTEPCLCGGTRGYGIEHDCVYTAHDPDEEPCENCGRYRCGCAWPTVEEGVKQ
jgi:hypothetical protein